MPFVTVEGSRKLNWDITYDRYDPLSGDKIQEGNGLKSLDLTCGERFDFNPNGVQMQEFVWRGQPNPIDMNWNEMPVYRVLTNKFDPCPKKPNPEKINKTDWGRFMRDYEREKFRGGLIYFEPHIEDIRVDEETNKAFPLWIIEKLEELGEFDQALTVNKVGLPGVPRLTKQEHTRIMKEIELRKEKENALKDGNIPRTPQQSKS